MIIFDTEFYPGYALFAALDTTTGKVFKTDTTKGLELSKISSIMSRWKCGFNSNAYDLPMIAAMLSGFDADNLKKFSDKLNTSGDSYWNVCRTYDIEIPNTWRNKHIDLFKIAKGRSSLKILGGRLHAKKMQDLPYEVDTVLTLEQQEQVSLYCENDLDTTRLLYEALLPEIDLRHSMIAEYGIEAMDSDAAVARKLLAAEIVKLGGSVQRTVTSPNIVHFTDTGFFEFETEQLATIYKRILEQDFELDDKGYVQMPDWLKRTVIEIGGAQYQMGIGGLHSKEERQFIKPTSTQILIDQDCTSMYPNIWLNQKLTPPGAGPMFLQVYQSVLDRRVKAKREGNKVVNETLKLVANSSFGSCGNKYAFLYSPKLLLQITLSGQLSLLMLIEQLSAIGVRIVSANTDGICILYEESCADAVEIINFNWELNVGMNLEYQRYDFLASQSVNNYVAKYYGRPYLKGKGCFGEPSLSKNPDSQVVYDAVKSLMLTGKPLGQYIHEEKDFRKFVEVRAVKGGAIWQDQLLGKAVRFYRSTEVPKEVCIRYKTNGNKVPSSDGCRPAMELPDELPSDIDYGWYEREAEKVLKSTNYA
jgi:hypothetical protein